MKANIKRNFKYLALAGVLTLTSLSLPISAYAMSSTTKKIIESETPATPKFEERNNFNLYVNGSKKTLKNNYVVVNGRTFIPVREVANLLGIHDQDISWDATNKVASLAKDGTLIEIPIGYTKANVDNEIKDIDETDTPASPTRSLLHNGVTYLPLRFLCENLDYNVEYDSATKTIRINSKNPLEPTFTGGGNTNEIHEFFKSKGGVLLEGYKTSHYSDRIDLNGDGKIAGFTAEEYNLLIGPSAGSAEDVKSLQFLFSGVELMEWYEKQYPAPANPPADKTKTVKSNNGWYWDTTEQMWDIDLDDGSKFSNIFDEWIKVRIQIGAFDGAANVLQELE
ncbi:MAG: hypothetical protein K2F59_01725 [Eubacteriales bacterium]|nr:hypothetical protein [Eubacteriales bacterium]